MYQLTQTNNYIHVIFDQEMASISNAVLGGGIHKIKHALNLKVHHRVGQEYPDPAETLSMFLQRNSWHGPALGMMTAASMKSLSTHHIEVNGLTLTAWVTAGLGNARRAGDTADYQSNVGIIKDKLSYQPGTINCWLLCSCPLSPSAMTEALMIMTEARTLACLDTGLLSPISQQPITGTGTDASAFICPQTSFDDEVQSWCGKHTQLGEMIATVTHTACRLALQKCIASA